MKGAGDNPSSGHLFHDQFEVEYADILMFTQICPGERPGSWIEVVDSDSVVREK